MAAQPYVESAADLVFQPPFNIDDVTVTGFVVMGDRSKIDAYCAQRLNLPGSPVEYQALLPVVFVTFISLGHMQSVNPPDSGKGFLSEKEADFWVLLAAGHRTASGAFVADRCVWHVPYLWVDSPQALLAGREVFGFPKHLGRFVMAENWREPDLLQAFAGVYDPFAPGTQFAERLILAARRTGPFKAGLGAASHWAGALGLWLGTFKDLHGGLILPGLGELRSALKSLILHQQTLVFLKQFRDAADPRLACHQEILEADVALDCFRGGGVINAPYEVEVPDSPSLPVAAQFGVGGERRENRVASNALIAYWADLDFTLGCGRRIWPPCGSEASS